MARSAECSIVTTTHDNGYPNNLEVCSTYTLSQPVEDQRLNGNYNGDESMSQQIKLPSRTSFYSTEHDQDRLSITDGKLSRNISLESKLLRYFSRVVEPDQVMEWIVKRSKLNQLIYLQTNKYLKSVYKMELDAGLGYHNPKAVICIHPYGCEEDANEYVTLELRMKFSSRSNCLKMHSDSRIVLKACAEDGDGNLIGNVRKIEDSARLSYFYIKKFIRHLDLKISRSEYIHFMFSCSYIDKTPVHRESSSWCQQ